MASILIYGQSKFEVQPNAGISIYGDAAGYGFGTDIIYNISSAANLGINIDYAKIDDETDLVFSKFGIFMEYTGKGENYSIAPILGFSYLDIENKTLDEKENSVGVDIGFKINFSKKSKLNYGLKTIGTYSSKFSASYIYSGAFFNFKF